MRLSSACFGQSIVCAQYGQNRLPGALDRYLQLEIPIGSASLTEREIRLRCLEEANRESRPRASISVHEPVGETTSEIIARAKAFTDFVLGKGAMTLPGCNKGIYPLPVNRAGRPRRRHDGD